MGAIGCILLIAVFYVLFLKFDNKFLREKYKRETVYKPIPRKIIFVTAVVSSVSATALLGWVFLIFLSF